MIVFQASRMFVLASVVWMAIAPAPAGGSLIQDFTFSGTNVSGSGTVVFDGAGSITDLDFSGTAWQDTYSFSNITGTGSLNSDWDVVSWNWASSVIFTDNGLHSLNSTGTNTIIAPIVPVINFFCGAQTAECSGSSNFETGIVVEFSPRHEVPTPPTVVLLAVGLVGCAFAGWRRWPKRAG